VPVSHSGTIADRPSQRPKGRRVHPAVRAAEGLTESLVAIDDDAKAFGRIADTLARFRGCVTRLETEAQARLERLRDAVLPEIRAAYDASEEAVATRRVAA